MERQDLILLQNLNNITEMEPSNQHNYRYTLTIPNDHKLYYSSCFSSVVVSLDKEQLNIFIENILNNCEDYFNYIIEDFGKWNADSMSYTIQTGTATIIYKDNYIYYTMYDDVFSNPYDFVKIKINDEIINRLRNLSNVLHN